MPLPPLVSAVEGGAEQIGSPTSTASGLLTFQFTGEGLFLTVSQVAEDSTAADPLSVTITWETDMPASSQVEYGPSPAYGFWSDLDPTLVTSHSVTLTKPQIQDDVTYYFRVHSEAASGEVGSGTGGPFNYDGAPPGPITDLRTSQ